MIGFCDDNDGLAIEMRAFDLFGYRNAPNEPEAAPNLFAALCEMAKLTKLRSLTIRNLLISKRDLVQLGELKHLQCLRLDHNGLTDDVMGSFPTLPEVTDISFESQQFTRVESFGGLRNLRQVHFRRVPLIDAGIRFLEYSQSTLAHVILDETKVTDDGMDPFLVCPNLKILYLAGSPITEKGISKVGGNDALSICVSPAQIDSAAAERFRVVHPRIRLDIVPSGIWPAEQR